MTMTAVFITVIVLCPLKIFPVNREAIIVPRLCSEIIRLIVCLDIPSSSATGLMKRLLQLVMMPMVVAITRQHVPTMIHP